MANAAWFFSTLAQSTAATVGFLIAFLASQYSVRRGRFRERAKQAEGDAQEFVRNYGHTFEEIQDELTRMNQTDDPRFLITELKEKSSRDKIQTWAESNEERALGSVYWVNRLFAQIESAAEPEDVFKNFTALAYPLNDLQDSCVGFPKEYDGLTVVREMKDEHGRIDTKIHQLNSAMSEDDIGPVIESSKFLFVIGVVLPTALLFTISEEIELLSAFKLEGYLLLGVQIINLMAVVVISWRLFGNLRNAVNVELF